MANLPKIKSITKKLVVALLGAFLIVFLLFHMCANLFIIVNDGGAGYSAFCHFMGTNFLIKFMEVGLMAAVAFHIIITIALWFQNRKARGNVRYHVASKSKTAKGSKLTIYTGIVILAFLILHFCNFYFVKTGIVKGDYFMAKTEEVFTNEEFVQDVRQLPQDMMQYVSMGMDPDDVINELETIVAEPIDANLSDSAKAAATIEKQQMAEHIATLKESAPMVKAFMEIQANGDNKWIKNISHDTKDLLENYDIEVEPDFYQTARNLFANKLYTVLYLLCFVALWLHLRHAFEAAMQTLGLTNYKYHRAIEVIGIAIAWIICLGFTIVPIIVCFF